MSSYTQVSSDLPLLECTIGDHFEGIVERFAHRDALIEVATGRHWSYSELNSAIDDFALGLMGLGVERGDRVGIWSPNCAEWTIVQYATAKIGAILVNVNPAFRISELEYVIRQCGMRMLISAPSDKNSDYTAMARDAFISCSDLHELVFIGTDTDPTRSGEFDYTALITAGHTVSLLDLRHRMNELTANDPINLQYTSGTTGFPKGATLTHRNILNNGFFIGELLNYTEHDRVVLPVPFYHCFGMVIGNLNIYSHGAAAILPGRSFTATAALQAVHDHGGTSLYGVPTMFMAELALPEFTTFNLSTLRTGVMAGSTCPEAVMNRVIDEMNMIDVAICYGMTETAPVSTMTRSEDTITQRTSTVGRTMPHLENKIINITTGETVERGKIGELCTRGYSVISGYWNEPDKTRDAIDQEDWIHTGDLASMDTHGYITVEGRIKDMVIRGGENIYPREIEEFLLHHPSIHDVQVIGVPDEKYGEELMACIILKPGVDPITAQDLAAFCHGRLAHFKIPRYTDVRDNFPLTVSGKIRKIDMRNEAIARLSTTS
ncbi:MULTISPECIES: AMP-binding protein [unclassified Cryobacterium]|uniref:AMP-binding protein n=1 Tax=unclassified Cryobacterium TaxID=2649013 RepID=UPI00106A5C5D|nr:MULTISPECIES: AMP-binding protein [unclassified Cryobacterium]TFD07650.1 AMP-binding protein [Cryobacterium sp. TMT1-66-1]TFD08061.1 AMP-binding protein [Cryobacterium sp. TMT1-2-2]